MVPIESLQEGRCVLCRIEQEREQDRQSRHGNESRSHRTDTSDGTSNKLEDAYRTLGCTAADPDAEIKRKFRALIKECHVDSLPKDLPEYLVKAANKRFMEVQEAYDLIRDARKMT
jgi:DnaJ like chaperone protein